MRRTGWKFMILAVAAALVAVGVLILRKDIQINPVLADKYELRGVDVSHYQGTIDWEELARQDLDFAFIKATEGSSYLDEYFYENWRDAGETGLYVGAYHFFSFDSEGTSQAQFYIETVGDLQGKLAPVIDIEYYENKKSNPPEKTEVVRNLKELLLILEEQYKVKPIIYTTRSAYKDYIEGAFPDYPLWVRSVYCPPDAIFGSDWTFWQYTDTAVLEGYAGEEKHIDMDVFWGTRAALEELLVSP